MLVNNAAIIDAGDGPPSAVEVDAVRRAMETNFLGTLAVTRAMLPLLREAPAGRIVNVSSGLGSITLNADPEWEFAPYKLLGYCASKAALNMLTVQLAFELREHADQGKLRRSWLYRDGSQRKYAAPRRPRKPRPSRSAWRCCRPMVQRVASFEPGELTLGKGSSVRCAMSFEVYAKRLLLSASGLFPPSVRGRRLVIRRTIDARSSAA